MAYKPRNIERFGAPFRPPSKSSPNSNPWRVAIIHDWRSLGNFVHCDLVRMDVSMVAQDDQDFSGEHNFGYD